MFYLLLLLVVASIVYVFATLAEETETRYKEMFGDKWRFALALFSLFIVVRLIWEKHGHYVVSLFNQCKEAFGSSKKED